MCSKTIQFMIYSAFTYRPFIGFSGLHFFTGETVSICWENYGIFRLESDLSPFRAKDASRIGVSWIFQQSSRDSESSALNPSDPICKHLKINFQSILPQEMDSIYKLACLVQTEWKTFDGNFTGARVDVSDK